MRVVVTGASGFVGPYVMAALGGAGHEVHGWDREAVGDVLALELGSSASVASALDRDRPPAIVHLAGWSHVGESWKSPTACYEANVVNSIRLLDRGADRGLKKFLFASSADVFGTVPTASLPVTEATPPDPGTPYAASKLAAEQGLALVAKHRGVELLVARPFNHVGPGQRTNFALPSFARQVAEIEAGTRDVLRHGNLAAKRDFLDVRDVARAYTLLLADGRSGAPYVIASGRSRSMEEVVRALFELAGIPPRMEVDPSLFRPGDTPEFRGDASRLSRETGWEPAIPFEETLRSILDDARARLRAGKP